MQVFPFVAGFAVVCFVMAYGTQKRTWWAWCGGWVFGALAAVAVGSLVLENLSIARTTFDWVISFVFLIGGVCVWTFWAMWWVKNRRMFSGVKKSKGAKEQ